MKYCGKHIVYSNGTEQHIYHNYFDGPKDNYFYIAKIKKDNIFSEGYWEITFNGTYYYFKAWIKHEPLINEFNRKLQKYENKN